MGIYVSEKTWTWLQLYSSLCFCILCCWWRLPSEPHRECYFLHMDQNSHATKVSGGYQFHKHLQKLLDSASVCLSSSFNEYIKLYLRPFDLCGMGNYTYHLNFGECHGSLLNLDMVMKMKRLLCHLASFRLFGSLSQKTISKEDSIEKKLHFGSRRCERGRERRKRFCKKKQRDQTSSVGIYLTTKCNVSYLFFFKQYCKGLWSYTSLELFLQIKVFCQGAFQDSVEISIQSCQRLLACQLLRSFSKLLIGSHFKSLS